MSKPTCQATTTAGYGCINTAKDGPYCPGHNPRNWCRRTTATGKPRKRRAASNGGPCTKHADYA